MTIPITYTSSRSTRSESQPPPVLPTMLEAPTTPTTVAATIAQAAVDEVCHLVHVERLRAHVAEEERHEQL